MAVESSPIKLIVGLGNPGEKYTKTRHNAGFLFLDNLLARYGQGESLKADKNLFGRSIKIALDGREVRLLAPDTFMNLSGKAVKAAVDYYKLEPEQVLVAHDELDLDPGIARLKLGGGHGGNNGLRDITRVLGGDFARLRIGIGHPGVGRDVSSYVLKRANKDDEHKIEIAIDESVAIVPQIVVGEFAAAMNQLHTRLSKPKKPKPANPDAMPDSKKEEA
ncbi:MAG: aminoacyl-tRNA hydrolase [Pseudomonadota bacterium]